MEGARESFEDWWEKRSELYPAHTKEMFWLAFADGWYRRGKL